MNYLKIGLAIILNMIQLNIYAQNHSTGGGSIILVEEEKLKCLSYQEDMNINLNDLKQSYNLSNKEDHNLTGLVELVEIRILSLQLKKLNRGLLPPNFTGEYMTCSCENEKGKIKDILKLFVASKELHCPKLSQPEKLFGKLHELSELL